MFGGFSLEKSEVIDNVCRLLSEKNSVECKSVIQNEYPFDFKEIGNRTYTEMQALSLFIRDGFIDRYSGKRLVFPGVLKVISNLFPEDFPYHKNWKMSECHIAYWELVPTIDHIVPIARGGSNDESNWICTSFLRNSAKSNFTLEELGWKILPAGDYREWDGLLLWFMNFVKENNHLLKDNYINKWFKVASKL